MNGADIVRELLLGRLLVMGAVFVGLLLLILVLGWVLRRTGGRR